MAAPSMKDNWTLSISDSHWDELVAHLFPGDGDEHGAVLSAGLVQTERGNRLLVRSVATATDGTDYVPGEHGYRMLTPSFVRDQVLDCADDGLAYLAVHNHGGTDTVGFSSDDLASHERGYPALRDILDGPIVGALVFARNAVAGDLWLPGGRRLPLDSMRIIGSSSTTLRPSPAASPAGVSATYDRQARLFGDRGQRLLSEQKVGVIGAGGIGSLVLEDLARLGVGHILAIDPDRLDVTNLPRVVGSTRWDARWPLTRPDAPAALQRIGRRLAAKKIDVARRVALAANPQVRFDAVYGSVVDDVVATQLIDCDYLFLAADTMQARLIFNALVHQYLIPGVQLGAKVTVDKASGDVLDVFSVVRPVHPDSGCLWCNGLISAAQLQEEAFTEDQRRRQRYVEEDDIPAPSVITLNAVAASHAVDQYLFHVTGLSEVRQRPYVRYIPLSGEVVAEAPRSDLMCRECGSDPRSRLGRGQQRRLPTR
jgi:hypothetical protein